ncbi:MAG TPA: fatty acid--CoA ligase [Acidimicrobiales bacterium]|nr:fatty acid--CoA ligase [Acidimicrobiales bacterium]
MESLADIVRGHAKAVPDRAALVDDERTITYAELDARSNRFAQGIRSEGLGAQDRVAFLDKTGPEYFEAVFGTAKLNAVLCAVNWRLAPPEAAYVINDSQAKLLIVSEEFLPMLDAIRGELTTIQKVLVLGNSPADESYETWLARQPSEDPRIDPAPNDVALQFYSSGTTGRPKGVMLTNENLFASVHANNEMLGFTDASVNLVAMPTFHVAGGAWGIVGLYNGCPNVLMREVDPAAVIDVIEQHRITHTVLVPAVIQFVLQLPQARTADFTSMEVLVYGASPISEEVLVDAVRTFGCSFVQAYGMTETTGGVVLLPPEDHDPAGPNKHRLRAAGKAMPGSEVKVVDAETLEAVPAGEVGEILIRSPQNMIGYHNLPEATAETLIADGWLRTGDAGYLDADGYVYIHDRVKDMIISGGENIYPAEIENALMSHPAIADVAVIGVPSERWGETPKAMVVAAPGATIDETEIIAFARERLAHYKCPTSVDVVDVLPRNPSGKILKRELRAPFWEGKARRVN